MNSFIGSWALVNQAIAPKALVVRVPETNIALSLADFTGLRDELQAQIITVQACLSQQQLARSDIKFSKVELLGYFNQFTSLMDGCYRNTRFYDLRPLAPSLGDGQETFSKPMFDMMNAWEEINKGPAPASVTLPLLLEDGLTQGSFASLVSALQFLYATEKGKESKVTLARSDRNIIQVKAYAVMKTYRQVLPGVIPQFPALLESMPRLTPLPGHTPEPVNASAIFQAPNASKIVYDASTDAMLHSYQLRGTVGDHYNEEDAVVIDTHGPNDPREFITTFGLNQPGAAVAFKVYVILTTDNEAGSAPLLVERPLAMPLAA
jgi:hypothetical protein